MPTWKKVIVSGSQAHLQGITASQVPVGGSENVLVITNTGEIRQVTQGTLTGTNTLSFVSMSIGGLGGSTGTLIADAAVDTLNINSADANLTISASQNGTVDTLTFDFADSPSFTNITASGDIAVNGGDITTTSTNFSLLAGATGTLTIGAAATTNTLPGNLSVEGNTTLGNAAADTASINAGRVNISNLPVGSSELAVLVTGSGGQVFTRQLAASAFSGGSGVSGSGTADRLVLWSGTNSVNDDADLSFNRSTNVLTIGSSTFGNDTNISTNLIVGGNTTLGDAAVDSVTVNAQTVTLANQLSATALSSTMLVITSSNRVATQTLGTGVATFLNAPSSANLAAAVTDETGTGTLVFSVSPTFTGTVQATNITTTGNVIVGGDLTVNGTTTTIDTTNLLVEDKFIILAHGSGSKAPIAEGGIIVEGSTDDKGQAFLFNSGSTLNVTGRWGLAADVHATSSDVTPTDFMVSVSQSAGAPSTAPTYGGSAGGYGNIYVNSSDESIWIFS